MVHGEHLVDEFERAYERFGFGQAAACGSDSAFEPCRDQVRHLAEFEGTPLFIEDEDGILDDVVVDPDFVIGEVRLLERDPTEDDVVSKSGVRIEVDAHLAGGWTKPYVKESSCIERSSWPEVGSGVRYPLEVLLQPLILSCPWRDVVCPPPGGQACPRSRNGIRGVGRRRDERFEPVRSRQPRWEDRDEFAHVILKHRAQLGLHRSVEEEEQPEVCVGGRSAISWIVALEGGPHERIGQTRVDDPLPDEARHPVPPDLVGIAISAALSEGGAQPVGDAPVVTVEKVRRFGDQCAEHIGGLSVSLGLKCSPSGRKQTIRAVRLSENDRTAYREGGERSECSQEPNP